MNKDEFAKAAKKAQQMNSQAFYRVILEERPDLKKLVEEGKVQPQFPYGGCSAHTVIIGDEVFKTSSAYAWPGIEIKDLILGIERECNLLGYLKDAELKVPKLTYVGKSLLFFGMSRLPGEPIGRWDVQNLPPAGKLKLAKELAAQCAGLTNAVPMEAAREMGMDVSPAERKFDPQQLHAKLEDPDVRKALGERYGFFRQAIEDYIDYHSKDYADNHEHIMHCDLKDGNILWDPKTKELTGLIDFGLSHLTGLESGFKKLCDKFPADFVDMVLEEYSGLQSVQLTRKDIQRWATVEYVDYLVDAVTSKKSAYVRQYNEYVRAPLRLPEPAPAAQKPVRKAGLKF